MTKRILLARHGTHDEVGRVLSGRSAIGLNAAGRAQADALARLLAGAGLRSIHASPRRRCAETAATVAALAELPVAIAAALDEIDFGGFTGRRFDALAPDPAWQRWNAHRATARCPGGETMAEAITRARAFLVALPAEQCPALCVSHCDVIRGLACDALGLDVQQLLALPCDPAGLTLLDVADDAVRLVTLNLRPDHPATQ